MKWFAGPVQDAIAAAKHEQKIFLVFVEGKDDTSKSMAVKISEENISDPIDENCVSIKLTTDSEPFRQFSQIYPVIVVPSMFFIGNNGIPLEVIAGSEDQSDLELKVQKAIELHKQKLSVPAMAPTSSSSGASSGTETAAAVAPPPAQTPSESTLLDVSVPSTHKATERTEEPQVEPNENVDNNSEEFATAQQLLKQKMERAEQLMAERRKIREIEEKEKEKQQELEHRRVSREMQKAREQMKEKEMADWAKERQREKQEAKAAREKVLAQIAQDKADRAAKFQYSPAASTPETGNKQPTEDTSVRQRSPQAGASNSQFARIQFRLPNSTTASHEFPSESTLQDVIRHVNQVIRPGLSNFSLVTSFPRRHFVKSDFSRTLQELELSPSAVLLVLPGSAVSPVSPSSGSGLWTMLWTLLSPLTLVWNFIYAFIFGSGSQRNGSAQPSSSSPSSNSPSSASKNDSQQNPGPSGSTSGSKPKANANSSRYHKDGNIHRLSNESGNDDEDGTWNGNSTQQM